MRKLSMISRCAFVVLALVMFKTNVYPQCASVGPEPNSTLSPTCSSQVTTTNGVGPGAYIYYAGFLPNTWYSLNLGNQPGTITCAESNFTDAGQTVLSSWSDILNITDTVLAPASTFYLLVQTAATSWNANSAALTYQVITPAAPAWSAAAPAACEGNTQTYSINPSTYATGYVWMVSGNSYINGVSGQTTLDTSATSITVTFPGPETADTITVYATNNGQCNSSSIMEVVEVDTTLGISIQPLGAIACQLGSASITTLGSGGGTYAYQWQYSDSGNWVNVSDGEPAGETYSGGTTSTLILNPGSNTPPGAYYYLCTMTNACGIAITDSVAVTILAISTDSITDTICPLTSVFGHTSTGTYVDTLTGSNGCDSLRTLFLTVLPLLSDTAFGTICSGDTFDGFTAAGVYVDTLTGGNGCDSFHVTVVTVLPLTYDTVPATICFGQSYTFNGVPVSAQGSYTDTLTGSNGCDSIVTLELTVLPVLYDTLPGTTCAGQAYNFNGTLISSPGSYNDTLTGSNGCDSIVTLNLTVLPVMFDTLSPQTICAGASYNFNGTLLTGAGSYNDTLTGSNGCDSIVTVSLTVLPVMFDTLPPQTICAGQSYNFNGTLLTGAGSYNDTLTGSNGCDSIVTQDLTVLPALYDTLPGTICPGQSYNFNGTLISSSGSYNDTLTGFNGCDSIVTLNLTILPYTYDTISQTICANQSFSFNGVPESIAGTYSYILTGSNGCDSIATLNLTVLPLSYDTISQTICPGQSYTFNGVPESLAGSYNDTLTGSNGCDSIVTLNLTVLPVLSDTIAPQTICAGTSYNFNGAVISSAGSYNDTLTGSNGCDSIVTLNVSVLPVLVDTLAPQTICAGQSYNFNGTIISGAGSYNDTLTGSNGCDSIVTLNLTVLPAYYDTISQTICPGQPFIFNGINIHGPGSYNDTLTGSNGCDSIVTLNLTVFALRYDTINQTICAGQIFLGHHASGTYVDTFPGAHGCDSIRTLYLTVSPAITSTITEQICAGDSFMGHHATGTYVDSLLNSGGCDSIVTLNLTVEPPLTAPVITQSANTLTAGVSGYRYQWYLNDTLLAGDTLETLHITVTGNYTVQITDSLGCTVTSNSYHAKLTAISDLANGMSLNIFPNPASGVLNIQADGLQAGAGVNIMVYNQIGQKVLSETQSPQGGRYFTQLDLQNLAPGVYEVQLQQGESIIRQKVVIER